MLVWSVRFLLLALLLDAGLLPLTPHSGVTEQPPATRVSINGPTELATDNDGHLFVIGSEENKVHRIDLRQGTIATIAGNGKACCYNDGVKATEVSLRFLSALAADSFGDVYLGANSRILKVEARTGLISTIAGGAESHNTIVGGPAQSARFWYIDGLAVDKDENVFVADGRQHKIFKINATNGFIHEFAGSGRGYDENAQLANAANFELVSGAIAIDPVGNLIVADYGNCRIKRIDRATSMIQIVAATADVKQACSSQPDRYVPGPFPSNPASDTSGNIYFIAGSKVFRVDAITSALSVFAGTNGTGFSGDRGSATLAKFSNPSGLAVDAAGNVYISDFVTNRVRRVDVKTGIVTTIAGDGLPHRRDLIL